MHNKNNKLKIKNICIMNNRGRQYYFLQINKNYKVWFQQTFSLDTNLEDIIKIRDQVLEDLKNEKLTPIRDIKKKEVNNMIKNKRVLNFVYTENLKDSEFHFYQNTKNDSMKIYSYLLELDFENAEYLEFFEHFQKEYHLSKRLFTFILESIKKANIKEFGEEVLVDMSEKPVFIPKEKIDKEKLPRDLPKNIQIYGNGLLVTIRKNGIKFRKQFPATTDINKLVTIRDFVISNKVISNEQIQEILERI